jgi:hypothetical protein
MPLAPSLPPHPPEESRTRPNCTTSTVRARRGTYEHTTTTGRGVRTCSCGRAPGTPSRRCPRSPGTPCLDARTHARTHACIGW